MISIVDICTVRKTSRNIVIVDCIKVILNYLVYLSDVNMMNFERRKHLEVGLGVKVSLR